MSGIFDNIIMLNLICVAQATTTLEGWRFEIFKLTCYDWFPSGEA